MTNKEFDEMMIYHKNMDRFREEQARRKIAEAEYLYVPSKKERFCNATLRNPWFWFIIGCVISVISIPLGAFMVVYAAILVIIDWAL
jgi:hypothetical protein